MTLKLDPQKIKDKLNEFIDQLGGIQHVSYDKGQSQMFSIDANIKTFLTVAFENAKERNRDYQGIVFAVSGLSPQQEQRNYARDIESRLRTLNSWVEEMKLILETNKGSSKIDQLKEQIEEKTLEAQRREKVAETKYHGSIIELLDLQRNMLKDKEENTKSLINLQKDVQDMKEILKELITKKEEDQDALK